jgi:hypothetical protein
LSFFSVLEIFGPGSSECRRLAPSAVGVSRKNVVACPERLTCTRPYREEHRLAKRHPHIQDTGRSHGTLVAEAQLPPGQQQGAMLETGKTTTNEPRADYKAGPVRKLGQPLRQTRTREPGLIGYCNYEKALMRMYAASLGPGKSGKTPTEANQCKKDPPRDDTAVVGSLQTRQACRDLWKHGYPQPADKLHTSASYLYVTATKI